jgi:hypothetical protein
VERVVAYYAGDFPEDEQEYAAVMRLLVGHPAAALVAAGLEAVPFNCLGFGLFEFLYPTEFTSRRAQTNNVELDPPPDGVPNLAL